jgi:glycosyltransferase involved in cell wall biosynthesis
MKARIAFLASAWGPRHGGINSFNADLALATAKAISERSMEVICVTAESVTDHELREARRFGVHLVTAAIRNSEHWGSGDTEAILGALQPAGESPNVLWWVGHDVITGEAAIALSQRAGGQCAVINHMSYIDYAGYRHGASRAAVAKRDRQRRLFGAANRRLAVGPLLQQRLAELVGIAADDVIELIPGLAEITTPGVRSQGLNAIVFGRLDPANDRIKQGRLAVSAFASAVAHARTRRAPASLLETPRITVVGISEAQEPGLKRLASSKAGAVVNLIALPFLEDRDRLLRELRQANLALTLSWHEGFGLTAWEAIAAQVPLVVGRNSGVYRLLDTVLPGGAAGFVEAVTVRGAESAQRGGHFRPEDEGEVRNAILKIAGDLTRAQERSQLLRALLWQYTWARTAEQLAHALELQSYTKRLVTFALPHPTDEGGGIHLPSYRGLSYESGVIASALLSESRLAYRTTDYEAAYSNSVRAADLFERYGFFTDAVVALIEAMSALRPARQSKRLREVILRIERLCAQNRIGTRARWLFLDRLALVLFDYARFSRAAQVIAASEELFRDVSSAENPQQLAFDSANSLRRRALIKGSARTLGDRRRVRYVLEQLAEQSQQFSRDRQFGSFVTNLDVASKLAADVLGEGELAHNYSQQALERRGDIDHWWALQEHLWREAEHYSAGGDEALKLEAMVEALKIHERWPVVLEPVAGESGYERGNLGAMVDRLGVDRLTLAERGVTLNALTVAPLRLSDRTIDRIVKAAMR